MFPSFDDLIADAVVLALPMRVRFRGITTREALLVRGPAGWGEFAPFVEYDDDEASQWLLAGIEAAWLGPPPALRDAVPVNATVPAIDASAVPELLERFPGARTAKVKVAEKGQSLAQDVARVNEVRRHIPNVRVDANGGWSVDEAITALRAITDDGELEYAEQPLCKRRGTGQGPRRGDRCADRCRREHSPCRGPVARRTSRGSGRRRREGAAAGAECVLWWRCRRSWWTTGCRWWSRVLWTRLWGCPRDWRPRQRCLRFRLPAVSVQAACSSGMSRSPEQPSTGLYPLVPSSLIRFCSRRWPRPQTGATGGWRGPGAAIGYSAVETSRISYSLGRDLMNISEE